MTVRRGDGGPAQTVRRAEPPATIRPPRSEPATSAAGGDSALLRLPSGLSDRFAVVREIPVSSGEADLLLVEPQHGDGPHSGQFIVKVYRRGLTLDTEVLGRILRGDPARVVRVHEFGQSDDRWWELQTYVAAGSLADLMVREGPSLPPALIHAVVRQLNDALRHLHADLDVVHRDLKPQNVLVLEREPLRLVLSDFGLATVAGFSLREASGSGTPMYFPPEVVAGFVGGRPRDYWALGMMVAEMAMGRHPFAGVQQATIAHHLGVRPVDVSGVDDDRLNLLCRGLLVRDPENRWGFAQVQAWLDGGDPGVQSDVASHATAAGGGFANFTFLGRQFSARPALASALGANWADGARLLAGTYQRQRMVNWLAQFPYDEGITDLLDGWDRDDPTPDRGLAELLVALDPSLERIPFRGRDLAGEGLGELAAEVIAGRGEGEAAELLRALLDERILAAYGRSTAHGHLAAVDARWRTLFEEFQTFVERAGAAGAPAVAPAIVEVARARLLLEALGDPDGTATELAGVSAPGAEALAAPWFRALSEGPQPGAGGRLALDLLVPIAAEHAETARREEERERLERQQREQEESARRLRQSVARTRRCLLPVVFVLAGAAVALVGVSFRLAAMREAATTPQAERVVEALSRMRILAAPYLLLAGAGFFLARRSKVRTREPEWRLMQAVCAVGSVLLPPLLPFTARYMFAGLRRAGDEAQRDRRLRPWALAGSILLGLYAMVIVLQSRYDSFGYLLDQWSLNARIWYVENWPRSLDIEALAANASWTAVLALVLAAAGAVTGLRSYHTRHAAERVVMQLAMLAGMAALPAVTAATAVLAVAAWFLFGAITVVILIIAVFILVMGFALSNTV